MKRIHIFLTFMLLAVSFATRATAATGPADEKIIILNEGNWQSDNAKISYFTNGAIVSNQWFRDVNGYKIGDTPNDIIQVNKDLIAIAVNWSNIIQFIRPDGTAVAATEDVPNNRKLCSDGRYVYVTSYAHECGPMLFTKGYVAKIDTQTFRVVAATEVGYEPEGIAYYNGHLFVANTGGYAFQEGHDYESTVSIINATTMEKVNDIDVGLINLYGKMSQSGKYLLINSCGDYYSTPGGSVVFDCERALEGSECSIMLELPVTYNSVATDGKFFTIGSQYSYLTGGYEMYLSVIDPVEIFESEGGSGIDESFPGTVADDIRQMQAPYGIYINPYTGYIYATDAGENVSAGALYQWSPEGDLLGKHKVYINPAHFLALPPDGHFNGINEIHNSKFIIQNYYNLNGQKLSAPTKGVNIINGKKFIHK